MLVVDLNAKRFELLSELVPEAKLFGLLVNPGNPSVADRNARQVRQATEIRRVPLVVLQATDGPQIDAAFATLAQRHADALLIGNDAYFNSARQHFVALAARYRLPVCYESIAAVRAGGLISYGASFQAMYHQLGDIAGRVLKGAKPADIPVEQPARFELAINLNTAKALGLTVPQLLLARADEVIE